MACALSLARPFSIHVAHACRVQLHGVNAASDANLGVLYDEYGRHAAVLVAVRQDLGNVFRRLRVLRDKIRSSRPDLVGDDDGDDE